MSGSIETGKIFNVAEPTGADAARSETTAAQAQAEAPTSEASRAVEYNAEQLQGAAQHAALAAKSLGKEFTGEPPSAADQLQAKTNSAVAQGKADVDAAKVEGQSYLEQAKNLAGSAISSAQSYLPNSNPATHPSTGGSTAITDTLSQIQAGATTVLATGKEYLASAQNTAQPHIDRALEVAQPHINKVSEAASNYINNVDGETDTSTSVPPRIPATSAPLESGPHVVSTPYPSTTTKVGE
ncbi:hypothetical protein DFH05DRAFT_1410441 [Lentinula detonsa]|uniref:Uncharacterized protein n=1 Tax=Lentinula detonsa TaxID=2804962 RepID=A0A9W8U2W3_9AGAR|nr:hypothetical protein DFH05DRAFT_1410441 [Lentinula detonsa]